MEHLEVSLTEEQRYNLKTLADYLLSDALKSDFTMSYFCSYSPLGYGVSTCGTVGCAVGHGPFAGVPKDPDEKWSAYSYRMFIDTEIDNAADLAWDFCFSNIWSAYDNTPQGAGHRILYLLKHGVPVMERDYRYHIDYKNVNY